MKQDLPERSAPARSANSRPGTGEKYERLLAGAAELMARRGFSETTMRDVARQTGFSLAGMYYYFHSKEDLLYQIQQRTFSTLLEQQQQAATGPGTARERLGRLIRSHLAFYVRHAHELKVCTYELESLTGEKYHAVERIRRDYFALAAQIVGQVMEEHGGRPASEKAVRHATLFLFGMLNWVFMWYRPRRDGSVDELADEMTAFALTGLVGSAP